MKKVKIKKMLNKLLDSELKNALRFGNNDVAVRADSDNAIAYCLKRVDGSLRIYQGDFRSIERQKKEDELQHKDSWYTIIFDESCKLSVHDPLDKNVILGVEFHTYITMHGNQLVSMDVSARFDDTLEPNLTVDYKFSESEGKWRNYTNASTFNTYDEYESRKFACALMLIQKVIIPKMVDTKKRIFNNCSQIELVEEYPY
tara:strand:+ start:1574 stop:2176 length:603 start_codon:yes stop_codon:yes gene_type:complete